MQTLTRSKFQHVIARSVATGQSVLLAVQHHRKQYFGRIRKMLRIRPKAHLSLPFPAGMRIATPVCALVRNDMQKTGTRQRMQGGGTRGKVRRRWQFCLVQRPCLCGHAACFCISLRGAQRRGNPFSLQYSIAESSTSGEYAAVYKFAQKRIYRCLSLRGRGLPHLVAPKSAMSSPQSPPCPAPAKGQSRATLPWVSFPHKACRFAGSRGYAVRRPAGEQRSLGAPLPAKGHPLRGPMHWFAMTC